MEPPNESNPDSSLPTDIVLNILGRVSKSYYPTISLVSKRFYSIIRSTELRMERTYLENYEHCLIVAFQPPTQGSERKWFSLWIKPDDHQTLPYSTSKLNSTGNCLLPVPSSYYPRLPKLKHLVGSDSYELDGQNTCSPSTAVWVYKNRTGDPQKAPSMTVARKYPLMFSTDDKLYVIGGCEADESTHWAEVFDIGTQTWEPLPDPGADLRLSSIKKLCFGKKEFQVRSTKNNYRYLVNESRWEVDEGLKENLKESTCEIDKVRYSYYNNECWWHDTEWDEWIPVQGLNIIKQYCKTYTEICEYDGKLVIVWVGPARSCPSVSTWEVWCAVILLKKRSNGKIWGKLEWADHVFNVPEDYTLTHCLLSWH